MSEQTVETTMPLGSNTVSIFKVCLFFFPNHIEIISYGAAIIFLNKLTFFSRQQGGYFKGWCFSAIYKKIKNNNN